MTCHHIKQPLWRNDEPLTYRQKMAYYAEWHHDGNSKIFGCANCGGATNENLSKSRICQHCDTLCLKSDELPVSAFSIEERVNFQSAMLIWSCTIHGGLGCKEPKIPDRSKPHQELDMVVVPEQLTVMPDVCAATLSFDAVYPTSQAKAAFNFLLSLEIKVKEVTEGQTLKHLLDMLQSEMFCSGSETGFYHNRCSLMDAFKHGRLYTCWIFETDELFHNYAYRNELYKASQRLSLEHHPIFLTGAADSLLPCFISLDEDRSHIEFLWVHTVLRRRGIGKLLVQSQGHVKKHLPWALPESRGFWDKLGFTYNLTYKVI